MYAFEHALYMRQIDTLRSIVAAEFVGGVSLEEAIQRIRRLTYEHLKSVFIEDKVEILLEDEVHERIQAGQFAVVDQKGGKHAHI